MKFRFDNPVLQMLARVGDLIIANFYFVVCCLPVVTAGASLAALNKVTQDIVHETEGGITRTFFAAFRQNFKQATAVWLCELVMIAALVCYALLIGIYCTGTLATVLSGILLSITLIAACYMAVLHGILVRYDNTLRQHMTNAGILLLVKLPRAFGMGLLWLMPAVLMYLCLMFLSVVSLFQVLGLYLIIGFAFTSYLCSVLLRPVFRELEKDPANIRIMR